MRFKVFPSAPLLEGGYKPIFTALMGVLIGLISLQIGGWLATALIVPQSPPLPVVQPSSQSPVSHMPQGQSLRFFGQPDLQSKNKPTVSIDTTTVKKTRLRLKLIGLIDLGGQGIALIEKGRETLVLKPGDTIQPGVTLKAILPNQVVIDHRGKAERLLLEGADEIPSSSTGSESSTRRPVDQQRLRQITQTLRRQPMRIANYVRFQPIRQNGRWTGVKIWSKADKALYRALGFREGDTIVSIDGKDIQTLSKNPQLWQKFLKQNHFELEVERQGRRQPLSIDLN